MMYQWLGWALFRLTHAGYMIPLFSFDKVKTKLKVNPKTMGAET